MDINNINLIFNIKNYIRFINTFNNSLISLDNIID